MKKEVYVSLVILLVIAGIFIFSDPSSVNQLKDNQLKSEKSGILRFFSDNIGCASDNDCSSSIPFCIDGICKTGCLEDSECSNGDTCNLETGKCFSKGECSSDQGCSSKTPRCDLSTSTCVECYDQYHCVGELVCNVDTNKCEEVVEEDKAEEEAAAKKAEEEAAAKKAVEEAATKKAEEEATAKKAEEAKSIVGQVILPPVEDYIDSFNVDGESKGSTLGDKYVAIKYEPTTNYKLSKIEFYTGLRMSLSSAVQLLVQVREDDNANSNFPKSDLLGKTKIPLQEVLSWQGTEFSTPILLKSGTVYWVVIKVEDNNPNVWSSMSKSGVKSDYRGSSSGVAWDGPYSNSWMMKFYGEKVESQVKVIENKCVDSDAGDEPNVYGTLKGSDVFGNVIDQTDQCSDDGKRLFEKVCTETSYTYNEHTCEFGCEDGTCLSEVKKTFYEDFDKDGYGSLEVTTEAGSTPEGYVVSSTDCNDKESSVYPGAVEVANDKVDQDCDGEDLVKITCQDSDGEDLSKVGTVKYQDEAGAEKTFDDKCIGLVGVLEGQCTKDGKFACLDEANCRNRCPSGQVCNGGACKTTTAQCTDSDRESRDKVGSVTFTDENGASQPTITDQCVGQWFVKEAVCNFVNQGRTKILKCEKGEICSNGACISSPEKCSDSDGKDREKKGTTTYTSRTGTSGQFVDRCNNNIYVTEGTCKGNTIFARMVPCPSGKICFDGACVEGKPEVKFSCKDSDGYNILVTGIAEYTDETGSYKKTETCVNSRMASEFYCVGTTLRTYNLVCPTGYNCNIGRCVKVPQQSKSSSGWWR